MMEGLQFEPCPVRPKGEGRRVIKCSVRKDDALRITLTAGAYEALGSPKALKVETARSADKGNFVRLTPALEGQGWPVVERPAPPKRKARPSASCVIEAHPFQPGVVHRSVECEAWWEDKDLQISVLLALPDWDAMLADIDGEQETHAA